MSHYAISSTRPLLGPIPLYHRRALPVRYGSSWYGKWGAVSRFYDKTCMIETMSGRRSITAVDRDMMNYVHMHRLRHYQMARSYNERTESTWRKNREGEFYRRRWGKKLQASFIAFMQFKTERCLKEQADLVTKYGQASVNRALGDPAFDTKSQKSERFAMLDRRIRAPPPIQPVKKYIATMYQLHPARFDLGWHQE